MFLTELSVTFKSHEISLYGNLDYIWIIDQACLVKMALFFFASLWTLTLSWPINMQKKNLANIVNTRIKEQMD